VKIIIKNIKDKSILIKLVSGSKKIAAASKATSTITGSYIIKELKLILFLLVFDFDNISASR
jgi:hypothetical protein